MCYSEECKIHSESGVDFSEQVGCDWARESSFLIVTVLVCMVFSISSKQKVLRVITIQSFFLVILLSIPPFSLLFCFVYSAFANVY